jgi:hypothetical protein
MMPPIKTPIGVNSQENNGDSRATTREGRR